MNPANDPSKRADSKLAACDDMRPLSGPHQKFCSGVAAGSNATEAYRAAYPNASPATAGKNAHRLMIKEKIKAEVARIRAEAAKLGGSAVLTILEKRMFLARIVRAQVDLLPNDSDLFESVETTKEGRKFKLPGKIAAILADNDLAGEGSEAEANDALAGLLGRVRK